MINFVEGDLFESGCDALTNAVNCVGVMGGGIALDFKNRFPKMFEEYRQVCADGLLRPGILHVWQEPDGPTIINFPTKDHFKDPSTLQYVADGLWQLHQWGFAHPDKSIAICKLGCGLGGLDWEDVRNYVEVFCADMPNELKVYGKANG